MEQLREADETLSSYIKSATYEEFQVLRHQYELKLLEEERIRKERGATNEEDDASKEKKRTAEEIPGKEKEKKKAFFAREAKKGGNRIKTGENGGKNYETIRGDSIVFCIFWIKEADEKWKRGNVDSPIEASDSENELSSPRESSVSRTIPTFDEFYNEEGRCEFGM